MYQEICQKTRKAFLWMSVANEPFVAFYLLIPFLLKKEWGISLLQLSILASLRPVLPVFSFYWSARLTEKREKLRSNLTGAWLLARAPFLLAPWIQNAWYLIFCCACYELFRQSGMPALIEILKINANKESRTSLYTVCLTISFVESIFLGLLMAQLLELPHLDWTVVLFVITLLSLTSVWVQRAIPLPLSISPTKEFAPVKSSWTKRMAKPWQEAIALLKKRPDFLHFQRGFMIGGVGLMLTTPALSLLYVDHLRLSSAEIALGKTVCMGLGVVLSSYFWKRFMITRNPEQMLVAVLMGFSGYLSLNYLAFFEGRLVYVANFVYGLAQAGSHLAWNLSGPIFAKDEESTQFSRVNVLMVAVRGAVTPALGGLLCYCWGPAPIFLIGIGISLFGVYFMKSVPLKPGLFRNPPLDPPVQ